MVSKTADYFFRGSINSRYTRHVQTNKTADYVYFSFTCHHVRIDNYMKKRKEKRKQNISSTLHRK